MFLELIMLGLLTMVLYIYFLMYNIRPKNYPPGPKSIPYIGAFLNVAVRGEFGMAEKFFEYGEQYGKIFAFDMGSVPCIMLNSTELIKEAFLDWRLCGRPRIETFRIVCGGEFRGFALHDGPAWKSHRKFTIKTLQDFGFNKNTLEPIIQEEAAELLKSLYPLVGQPISTEHKFNYSVINILWTIIGGSRFDHNDPRLIELIRIISDATSQSKKLGIFFFPWLATTFPYLSGWTRFTKTANALHEFSRDFVTKRRETHVEGMQRDLTDVYIDELKKRDGIDPSFSGKLGEENMQTCLVDLFFAGSETSSTTLSWTLLYLALNQDVQKKVQEEIDQIIGNSTPSLDHRNSMPYLQAVIQESLRCSSVSQVGIPHYSLEETTFAGFTIPKGVFILSNVWAAHHDPAVFPQPFEFRPERFLSISQDSDKDKDNNQVLSVVKSEGFIAFSSGKRSCPGETLARDQIFIFISNILQHFKVIPDPSQPRPSTRAKFCLTRSPLPHNLVLLPRKSEGWQKQQQQ